MAENLGDFFPGLRTVHQGEDLIYLCFGLDETPTALVLVYNKAKNTLERSSSDALPKGLPLDRGLRVFDETVGRSGFSFASTGLAIDLRGTTYWGLEPVFPHVTSVDMQRYGSVGIAWSTALPPEEIPADFDPFGPGYRRARWRYPEGTELGVDIFKYSPDGKNERLASFVLPWAKGFFSTKYGSPDGMEDARHIRMIKNENLIVFTPGFDRVYVFRW